MKTNTNYIYRNIAGESVLVPTGSAAQKINGMISMTPTAAFIWEHLGECRDEEEMVKLLLEEFDVDEEIAHRDVYGFIATLREMDMLE